MGSDVLTAATAYDYSDGPEDIRAIAARIRAGESLDPSVLERVGPDALSRAYHSEEHQRFYLLHDTLLHRNPAAAEALVAAGADVNYDNHLMVFSALRMRDGPSLRPFPDYSPGIPFLRLYLENGGDPNAQASRYNSDLTTLTWANNNLEGILVLLEGNADPWLQLPFPEGHLMRSFFDSLAFSSSGIVSGEIMFRIAHAGHFEGATPEQLQIVFDSFERTLRDLEGTRNRRQLQAAWYRQTILDAITETTGAPLPPALARLMETRVPDEYGGWWMRPDQIRSGDEYTGGEITPGTLIWTHADPTPRQRPQE